MPSDTNINNKEYKVASPNNGSQMSDNEPSDGPIQLKKQLGLMNGVGIIVGVIIGSGIFISPKGVLLNAGSVGLSMIVWLSCGLLVMCGALCYAELGTAIPKSGGEFAYLKESFGPLSAFLYIWVTFLIIYPTGNAIIALTFAEYILSPLYSGCKAPELAVQLVAAAVTVFLTFVNCYNVKWSTRITDSVAFAKVVALIIIIFAGAIYLFSEIFGAQIWQPIMLKKYIIKNFNVTGSCVSGKPGNTEHISDPFTDSSWSFSDIALAFYSGMFSFSGWNCLNFVTEELKHPTRDLPRAIYISIPLISLIYLLTNIAYFSVMSTEEILASEAVAGDFGNKILGVMAWIMPLCVALSCFGSLNGGIFACARLFFVGAREGHLPNIVSMITVKYLTPSPSLIFICIITILYLWVGGVYVLINFTSFIEALFLTATIGALLYLRIKDPNTHRPIKVNLFFPIVFLLVGTLLVILPFYKSFVQTGIALLITLTGIPVYFIFVVWKTKPKWISDISDSVTRFIQCVLVCSPEEENIWSDETQCLSVSSINSDAVPELKKD